jgi:hypothetical protein
LKFVVRTPIGFDVRCPDAVWEKVTTVKHVDLDGRLSDVMATLTDPDEIRESKADSDVLLFYRGSKPRFICAVIRSGPDAFLITAYQTNAMKSGDIVWQKSK